MAGLPVQQQHLTPEDALLEQTARYFAYADRHGWTPEQVDNLPALIEARWFTVAAVADELRQEEQDRANRSARSRP